MSRGWGVGDWEAARQVQLELPETGVCSSSPLGEADNAPCCGAELAADDQRGLATGISDRLLTLPLATVGQQASGGSCCGCAQ